MSVWREVKKSKTEFCNFLSPGQCEIDEIDKRVPPGEAGGSGEEYDTDPQIKG